MSEFCTRLMAFRALLSLTYGITSRVLIIMLGGFPMMVFT